MKILLTGAAGFIGFHTTKKLLERGDEVIGIDNLNNYYDKKLKLDRLTLLKKYKRFEFVKKNISEGIPSIDQVDGIINLAAQAGVRYSIENPLEYEKSNNLGTLQVFEYARHNKIKNIVFASSSSVYGNVTEYPFHEEMKIDTPISLYAATKKSNEEYAYVYNHLYGINMTGLRFFTVYGPFGRPDMALFIFTKNISENKPINVFNHGNMKRDFTYVDDIVSGVVSALDNINGYNIYNLAGGRSVELNYFIKEIENNLGKNAIRNNLEIQPGDVLKSDADITKAKNELNYSPKTSIEEGIKNFVNWYKDYYSLK
ncbi:NAD-dependent epimerase/dehydratase family protein [Candidatus Woesearchaeota archaeon]|nr:NAD-dependent epimerase/dehydratase family protein [Candidatus Woesearchaeota archaeon]MCF7900758.1 NAD-dependent epimerase/dehydratase family protein [Candidatus Woesearchaeota archaeon]MCF8012923.1 NAD-dependent epimerase/dehydratase family protein [Candidatus Woesearchaeota archaeon]